jgi:hypothetical protein
MIEAIARIQSRVDQKRGSGARTRPRPGLEIGSEALCQMAQLAVGPYEEKV